MSAGNVNPSLIHEENSASIDDSQSTTSNKNGNFSDDIIEKISSKSKNSDKEDFAKIALELYQQSREELKRKVDENHRLQKRVGTLESLLKTGDEQFEHLKIDGEKMRCALEKKNELLTEELHKQSLQHSEELDSQKLQHSECEAKLEAFQTRIAELEQSRSVVEHIQKLEAKLQEKLSTETQMLKSQSEELKGIIGGLIVKSDADKQNEELKSNVEGLTKQIQVLTDGFRKQKSDYERQHCDNTKLIKALREELECKSIESEKKRAN